MLIFLEVGFNARFGLDPALKYFPIPRWANRNDTGIAD